MFKIELCIKVAQKMCKRSGQFATKSANLAKADNFASTQRRDNLAPTAGKRQFCTNITKETIWHHEHKHTIGNDVWTILHPANKEEFLKGINN